MLRASASYTCHQQHWHVLLMYVCMRAHVSDHFERDKPWRTRYVNFCVFSISQVIGLAQRHTSRWAYAFSGVESCSTLWRIRNPVSHDVLCLLSNVGCFETVPLWEETYSYCVRNRSEFYSRLCQTSPPPEFYYTPNWDLKSFKR